MWRNKSAQANQALIDRYNEAQTRAAVYESRLKKATDERDRLAGENLKLQQMVAVAQARAQIQEDNMDKLLGALARLLREA